jgi:hypothetical protein
MGTELGMPNCRGCDLPLWIEDGDGDIAFFVLADDGELVEVEHCPRCGEWLAWDGLDGAGGPLAM